jgi:hypothetical protein
VIVAPTVPERRTLRWPGVDSIFYPAGPDRSRVGALDFRITDSAVLGETNKGGGAMRLRRRFVTVLMAGGLALSVTGCAWGLVTDSQTGEAVPGAQITFHDSEGNSGTISANEGGLYAFDLNTGPIPARGMVTYEVTAPGYEALTVQRDIQYDDNPAGTWEVQHFALRPEGTWYHSEDGGFSIVFPAEWEIAEEGEVFEGLEGTAVLALSPSEGPADEFLESVVAGVEEVSPGTSLAVYLTANLQHMKAATDYREHSRGDATIGGEPAKWAVVSWVDEGTNITALAYFLVKEGHGYFIICYAESSQFPGHRNMFESIAQTFKFE